MCFFLKSWLHEVHLKDGFLEVAEEFLMGGDPTSDFE